MMMTQEDLAGILRENGCFDFLREPAKAAAEVILRACPDGAGTVPGWRCYIFIRL